MLQDTCLVIGTEPARLHAAAHSSTQISTIVNLGTWNAEIKRIMFQGQPRQIVYNKILYPK
jgi:hypothetical protein